MPFDLIPQEYYPLISDYVKILVPSFITYLVTKYTFTRQRRYEIKEKQFNRVYLPLHQLSEQYIRNNNPYTEETLCLYIKKVEKLLYKNYQYVYPKTLKMFDTLKNNKTTKNTFFFEYQASFDFEFLKKELGYPTNSFFDLYHRLTRADKLLYALFLICIVAGIFALTSSFTLLLSGDLLNGFSALGVFAFTLPLIYFLNLIIKR